jgi:hypothetical protein
VSIASGDLVFDLIWSSISLAVFVASFRRGRLLDGKPIAVVALIAIISAFCVPIWLFVTAVNRRQLAREWDAWRAAKSSTEAPAA